MAVKFKICNQLHLCKENQMLMVSNTLSNFPVPGELLAISAKVELSSKGSMEPGIELFLFIYLVASSSFPPKEGETTCGSMEPLAEEM
uniref:Uncharacterized protein n=1 Tax=Romanomermis culicivorax TaxID=13658 RepID=A0A915HIE5_ROMCU